MVKIDSAHYIKDYEGKCSRLHGHTWEILILEPFSELGRDGIARDFKYLPSGSVKEVYDWAEKVLDHRVLNEVFGVEDLTSEVLAKKIFSTARLLLGEKEFLVLVREGDGGVCVYDGKRWWLGK